MTDDKLLLEKDGAIAFITFNNPKAMNALTIEMFDELDKLLDELLADDAIRVLVLTGAGEKAFVAGGNIGYVATLDAEGARGFALQAQLLFEKIEAFPKPVIAAVNGYALGAGCELAMACDVIVATETAKFGQPEVKLGIIPGFAGTQRLARLVGKAKAKELIFTGDMIDAVEACRIGLINKVVGEAELFAEVRSIAGRITGNSATAITLAKEAIENGLEMDFIRASRYEADLFALCFTTGDCREGISAFLEKRPAKFSR